MKNALFVIAGLVMVAILVTYVTFTAPSPLAPAPLPAGASATAAVAEQVALQQASAQAEANAPPVGGAFTLNDDKGNVVTERTMLGKYHLIFFGFTNCPDKCPAMLGTMDWVTRNLPPEDAAKVQMVFVSVDPARDDLKTLGDYVRGFNPSFVGWTGTKEQVDAMVKNYLAYYAIKAASPTEADPNANDGEYMVDHSTFLYLMGPDGQYVMHFRNSEGATTIRDKLSEIL